MTIPNFVNRTNELAALDRWWTAQHQAAVVWGRRRVGKTALLQRFAADKPTVFHTGANRGEPGELRILAQGVAAAFPQGLRDPAQRPYTSWDDALDDLAGRSLDRPILVILDEFPELVASSPSLPGTLRAFLDRARGATRLRLLLCGSAVRHMEALQQERQPLYGRFDLALPVHPFDQHEAALILDRLPPSERAAVYGIVGGMPLYLSWWDQSATVEANLAQLVCEPGARLLTEGDLVLRTDVDRGEYPSQVLHAIATGRTQYGEIKDYIKAEPQRTLDRLVALRLVERLRPAGEPVSSKRRLYRITDPFLRFYLGTIERYFTEIQRGLGPSIAVVLRDALDDHMGDVWEEAFRAELRRRAATGTLGVDGAVIEIGSWWDSSGHNQIDALVLAGRSATPVMAGEAKWATSADAAALVTRVKKKADTGLHLDPDTLRYAVCARTTLTNVDPSVLALTAADLFSID